jgi:hypothetical protein
MKAKFRKFFIAACIISPFVFFGVVVVLADVWSGPANRTQTTPGACRVIHKHNGSWVCTEPCGEPEYNICTAACNAAGGCDSSETQQDPPTVVQLQDATVSGTTSCSSTGDNGWCKGVGALHLSGNEPVSGYSITGFDSTLYGPLCSGASCAWNFPQGVTTNLGYWANSSFGDQSNEAFASMSVDSVAPTLTLTIPSPNGSNGWNKSGPVTASASATDATSGVASVKINGSGPTFAASTDGVYSLAASATDKAGNTATTSGTIRLDTTPPNLSVSPAAPDGSNNWYVSPAVLNATDSDTTSGIAGTQYQVDGGSWQNGASLSEGTDGIHTIVFRATDNAGNTTTAAPVTVTVDRTAPVANASLSPASPNGANGWYTSPVTVTANSSDATSGIASQGVSLDGSTWTPSLTISTDGTYTVQEQAQDKAGNTASTTKSVKLDTTPPSLSVSSAAPDGSNNWYVSPAVVTATDSDATSGMASTQYQVDGGPWQNGSSLSEGTDGTHTIVFRATDNAGNTTTAAPVTVTVDRTPPVANASLSPASPNGANGWYTSPVTITANSSDATSGLTSQGVSLNGSTWTPSLTISTDGTYTVQVSAKDKAGNTASTTKLVKLDTTPPTVSFQQPAADGANGWYLSSVTVAVTGTDATSGIGSQVVSLDGSTWVSSLTLSTDGVYTVHGRVTDNAGNVTNATQIISIDHTPPIADASLSPASPNGANSWYTSPVTVTANSSDATSGLTSQGVSLDGSTWAPSLTISTDGIYTVQVHAQDKAGNTASTTKTFKLDNTPPTVSFQHPAVDGANGWYLSSVTVTVTGTDAASGVGSQQVSLDGSSWASSLTLSTDGIYTVHGRVTDNAGNVTNATQTISIDQHPPVVGTPVLTGTLGLAGWYTSNVGVSVSATDATSGVASIQDSVDGGAWQTTAPTLTDGVHTVQIRVTDNAGNITTTSTSASVDATPPVSAFISPSEGSTVNVSGNKVITMTGSTSDATSGVSGAEISLDGGTAWQSLPLGAGGTWSYNWNGLRDNGTYIFLVRATDIAGNLEHTAKVTIVVGNQPPSVSLTPLWLDFGSAKVTIKSGSLPVAGASITVKDPQGRWPDAVFSYGGSNLPTKFSWLGRMGDGSIAYVGKYNVSAKAWDSFGNTGNAYGWVIIPLPLPLATSTPTPTSTPIPTQNVPLTGTGEPTKQVTAVVLPRTTPVATVAHSSPEVKKPTNLSLAPKVFTQPRVLFPTIGIISLFIALSSASVTDPRPKAIRNLAAMLKGYADKSNRYKKE